ncbi:hypothetical protein [Sphaerotilus uruguayifluvii]|uniref:Uncharacterized protein n=1 Tax=Sphaerotilus uruguayifluvii TaxID=2735897 RepID=A0ABX2G760_9BURK|nr:hypothetical protein [Leptothrix sp. C29]NRT58142.1 hypothetical protein [Leptothrix sp. C29]
MAFSTNKRTFLNFASPAPLLKTYCILVAIELALKDAAVPAGRGGHDVPTMLDNVADSISGAPSISGALKSISLQLRRDLASITCQEKGGAVGNVPPYSYPYIRYSRHSGDWGGVNETSPALISGLEVTCNNLLGLLTTHGSTIGVHL